MTGGVHRRRLTALLAGLVLLAGAVVGIVIAGGSRGPAPHYVPAGGRAETTAAPRVTQSRTATVAFHAAPAAVRAVNAMPLATRVAQLFLVSVGGPVPAGAPPWGGIVLTRSNAVPGLPALLARLRGLRAPAHVRPLIAVDQPGGAGNALPGLPPLGEAALARDGVPAAAGAQAAAAGAQLRARGIRMTLAPEADVDVTGGAFTGTLFSSDPRTVGQYTAAALRGYARTGTIAAVGHFPGQGSASADPDAATAAATVGGSLASLRASDLVPFGAVADRAAVIEMSNAVYAAFDGVTPASLSPAAVSLLRGELHYSGVVMSGDLDATLNVPGTTPAQAALAALRAGDDLLYIGGPPAEQLAAYDGLLTAARRSSALRGAVREALLHDLTLKARYGLAR